MNKLVLASSSPYRKALLERLRLPFECVNPEVDESSFEGESPEKLVQRLALEKAKAVAQQSPNSLIIGSDQVASLNGCILTKPGNFERAAEQLRQQSGEQITFYTGLALCNSSTRQSEIDVINTVVTFRELDEQAITRYLELDQPWNCAGSFKAEGLGISLFKGIASNDPSALIGLPLIRLCEMLRTQGVNI